MTQKTYQHFLDWIEESKKCVKEEDDESLDSSKKSKNKVIVHDGDEDCDKTRVSEETELDEGTLLVHRHKSYARPGQGPDKHAITKDHGVAPDGSRVYSVKQPNGFHGVLAVKDHAVVGSSHNNLSKDEAHSLGSHYAKHGAVGIGVGKNWSLGSGIHGKVVKEETELDEAAIKKLPRRHFFDSYGTKGHGIAYTDNKNWWKVENGTPVAHTADHEVVRGWKKDLAAKSKMQEEAELDESILGDKNDGAYKAGHQPKGRVVKGKSYGADYEDEEGSEEGSKKKAAPEVKRGRGRPKKGADETGEVKKYTFHDLLNKLSR